MDCEKFEAAMIDELYDELDELTSAAAKRHVAGCARCAALFGGLRATRRVLASAGGVPLADPPPSLEERILAATREARKVVPIRRRLAEAISAAGSWAMRPQTQMAAVFLLMVGTSVVFLRGGKKAAQAPTAVAEQGAPAASVVALVNREESLDTAAANAAHGAPTKPASEPPAAVAAAASAARPADEAQSGIGNAGLGPLAGADKGLALNDPSADDETRGGAPMRRAQGSGAVGGGGTYPRAPAAPPAMARAASPAPTQAAVADAPAGAAKKDNSADRATSAFDAARKLYEQKSYAEATRQFDLLAQNGDANAALWAARSTRDGSGCGAAMTRYDDLASQQGGTPVGNDALLEGGRCLRTLGQFDGARTRLLRLLSVPSHMDRAQRELDAMSPPAAAKAAPRRAAEPVQQQAPSNKAGEAY